MPHYTPGDSVHVQTLFHNDEGLARDPDTVTYTSIDPHGVVLVYVYGVDPEVVKQGVGDYVVYQPLDLAGYWRMKWVGTGTLQSAEETTLTVRESVFP